MTSAQTALRLAEIILHVHRLNPNVLNEGDDDEKDGVDSDGRPIVIRTVIPAVQWEEVVDGVFSNQTCTLDLRAAITAHEDALIREMLAKMESPSPAKSSKRASARRVSP